MPSAIVRGTRARPVVTGQMTIREGRVFRVSYQSLAGKVGYEDGLLVVDLRLDQSPGVWFTAAGTVPPTLFAPDAPEMPVNVAIRSSNVGLGLIEGVTNAVRDVTGVALANIDVVGTMRDPHFVGSLELMAAGFVVSEPAHATTTATRSSTSPRIGSRSRRFISKTGIAIP